jgi:hypothetical protein
MVPPMIPVVALFLIAGAPAPGSPDDFITPAAGKIVVTTDDLPTEASDMARLLKPAVKKSDPYKVEGDKSWSVNLVAVLKKEAKGSSVHVVFYDRDDKAALKKFEPVRAIEVHPAAHNKLLQVPQVEFNADQGFAGGKTYIVRVTELENNHEVVLAETQMTLTGPPPPKEETKDETPQ